MSIRSQRANWLGIIPVLAVAVAAWGQATTAPAEPPLDPEVDKILTRLEQREVHDLHARVIWHQTYVTDEAEDAVSKRGELWYQAGQPAAKFLVYFKDQISGNGERRELNDKYAFDGCWYTELQSRTKTVTRREIRRPNDPGDPYKVGEGVFPLPFGQKKADILREFEVQLIPHAEKDPPDTDHVQLTPREGTETARTYKRLDFWISRTGKLAGLPIQVKVAKLKPTRQLDSYITITFDDVELNPGFNGSVFELKTPLGYHEEVERLEEAAPPPASDGTKP